ncbi:uncharacterized protein LOC132309340 [Cornus florida]|uniref:uncharacterized protein LOC132309340 n=1 Tax=Cornus florida TaxID=4283 RepID=UPI0028987B22|nr:uncharacterized protein LOC132309340 [Cornus florida]
MKTAIQQTHIHAGSDQIKWKHGNFSLKAAWNCCRVTGNRCKWARLCWKHCRSRISLCVVIILHNKNLSFVNLQKRGLPVTSICHNCYAGDDSNEHLFYHCGFVVEIWRGVFDLLQLQVPQFLSLNHIVAWFLYNTTTKSLKSKILNGTFPVTLWKIWSSRNAMLHTGIQEQSSHAVQAIIWDVITYLNINLVDLLIVFGL